MQLKRVMMWVPVLLLAFSACATGRSARTGEAGAPSAPSAVERFLQLANQRDYPAMGWVFGTREGAFASRVPAREAELRMYLFSCLLQHQRSEMRGARPLPGTSGNQVQYEVLLTRGRVVDTVPFVSVRGPGDRWFIQEFGIEILTRSPAPLPRECAPTARPQVAQ